MSSIHDVFISGFFRGYYRYTAFLNRLLPTTKVDGHVIKVLPSVCKPLGNEQVLAEYVPTSKNVLEIGCGSGVITLFLADKSSHVTAVDISEDAVDNTRINLAANGIENVTLVLGNAFEKVSGLFDVVASNPPWVDFELDDPLRMWASSSTLIPGLFRESGRFLVDNGLLVISCPSHAEEKLVEMGRTNGFELLESHAREKHNTFGVRLLTLAYLQVGFHPRVYVFEKVARPEAG